MSHDYENRSLMIHMKPVTEPDDIDFAVRFLEAYKLNLPEPLTAEQQALSDKLDCEACE